MSRRKILVADLLCGAGGSTTGALRALLEMGFTVDDIEFVCVNHWPTAIETHSRNHPEARHYVQDIATGRPHLMVPEGYLDLLMASPTCTHHSVARGGKPTSDQQRSDPWHIITWLTELRVKRIIIENVWEFTKWGPVNVQTGKPIKSREGEYFWAWINALKALGFTKLEWRKLNAADYGDATTRQRFILMGRSDGKPLQWPAPTHMKRPAEGLALFPLLKPWKPAREIIDWNIKGRSIFNRKKPLAAKTLARIYAGAVKHGWPDPYLVILRNHMAALGVDGPVPTIAANGLHIGLAQPVLINMKKAAAPGSISTPLPTQTASASHLGIAEPLVLSQHNSGAARSAGDPLPTITTGGAGAETHPGCARPMLAEPVVVRTNMHGRKSPGARGAEDPLMTITTDGGIAIAEPVIMNGRKNNQAKGVDTEPVPTLDTKGGVWLAEPFVLSQASGGAPRSTAQPLPTIVTGGQRGSGTALISPYYGSGSGETCTSADEVLPTVTSKARFGMVVPVTHTQGGNSARDTEQPLPTITTAKGGEQALVTPYYGRSEPRVVGDPLGTVTTADRFGLVVPVTHAGGHDRAFSNDEPLPIVTGANRGELAFITAQHGERPGQAPRTHSVDAPTPTVAATGHVDLVEGVEGYDILFRMLEPHELAAAMGFTTEDLKYEFAGTKTDQIKQIGNAVSVAKMKACVGAIMADAAPKGGAIHGQARGEAA